MGLDLQAINPNEKLKATPDEGWNRYRFSEWEVLVRFLELHGMDVSEFAIDNSENGAISEEKCMQIADFLEEDLEASKQMFGERVLNDIVFWRYCGGADQC